jgi:transposase
MSERQRKNYDRKFKEETVKYIQQHSKPVTEIAVEMNIPVGTLNNWLLRYRQSPDEPFVGSGNFASKTNESSNWSNMFGT